MPITNMIQTTAVIEYILFKPDGSIDVTLSNMAGGVRVPDVSVTIPLDAVSAVLDRPMEASSRTVRDLIADSVYEYLTSNNIVPGTVV